MNILGEFIYYGVSTCHKNFHFANSLTHRIVKVLMLKFNQSEDEISTYQIHFGNVAVKRLR